MKMKTIEKEYITKQELCQMYNICASTAYKLLKSKKIHFEKCCDRLLHYYKIPISEVEQYMQQQANRGHFTDEQKKVIAQYYRRKMRGYPDRLESKHIQVITGYGKEAIRKWINSEKILGVVVRKRFAVAKEDLIDFLVTPYFANITRKSKTHIADFLAIGLL